MEPVCEVHGTPLLIDEDRGGNRFAYCTECEDEWLRRFGPPGSPTTRQARLCE